MNTKVTTLLSNEVGQASLDKTRPVAEFRSRDFAAFSKAFENEVQILGQTHHKAPPHVVKTVGKKIDLGSNYQLWVVAEIAKSTRIKT